MSITKRALVALIAAPLAATLLISCSSASEQSPDQAAATPGATSTPLTAAGDDGTQAEGGPAEDDGSPSAAPVLVRDAFAGLQATYNGSCASDCAYFLGRVHDELQELDAAMKADPKGPGHFREPIAWTEELRTTLAGDRSYANLKKHQTRLIGTRDRINTWMQGHPDDYR
ncbi:hypothetical protein AB0D99_02000 [Streptomyces sp. NPDC047971]|uniref:hypothetical protein n=1 Tax=Streptomyces sp. NPDC047971 TaxID=3154499 RepID=UPI0033FED1E9